MFGHARGLPGGLALGVVGGRGVVAVWRVEGEFEPGGGAVSGFAVGADGSVHQVGEFACDCESEAAAAVFAGG